MQPYYFAHIIYLRFRLANDVAQSLTAVSSVDKTILCLLGLVISSDFLLCDPKYWSFWMVVCPDIKGRCGLYQPSQNS